MAAARTHLMNLVYAIQNFDGAEMRRAAKLVEEGRQAQGASVADIERKYPEGFESFEEEKKAELESRAEAVATEIREWDCRRIADLKKLLDELSVICDALGQSDDDYIDITEPNSLPTVETPSEFFKNGWRHRDLSYGVWAMDLQGNCLCGEAADKIKNIRDVVADRNVELDDLVEYEARKEGLIPVNADALAAVNPAKIRELGHDGQPEKGHVLRWHRFGHVIVDARKIFGTRWAYRDLNLDPARVDEIAEKVRDHGRGMKSHDAEYIADALLCGEPVYVFDSGSDGEDDILVGPEVGIREELIDFHGEWREHWTLTAIHLVGGEIATGRTE